jgi:serine protease
LIDNGFAGEGWDRTGEGFRAIQSGYCYGSYPVFRFYGAGANSHFFTVDPQECGQLRNRDPGWQFEGDAFGAEAPVNGMCGFGSQAVYRLYNNRWMLSDSNHRFVTRLDLYEAMKARGWVGEGVAFCVRQS